jgi:hypothetical protein
MYPCSYPFAAITGNVIVILAQIIVATQMVRELLFSSSKLLALFVSASVVFDRSLKRSLLEAGTSLHWWLSALRARLDLRCLLS